MALEKGLQWEKTRKNSLGQTRLLKRRAGAYAFFNLGMAGILLGQNTKPRPLSPLASMDVLDELASEAVFVD